MPTEAAGRAVPKSRSGRRPRKLILSERVAVAGLLAIVFVAVLAFGASDVATAAAFSSVSSKPARTARAPLCAHGETGREGGSCPESPR